MQIHPLKNAIEALIGPLPLMIGKDNFPIAQALENVIYSTELDDQIILRLQDYCSSHARPAWATGESIIDAADLLVERAIENANLEILNENNKRDVVFLRG